MTGRCLGLLCLSLVTLAPVQAAEPGRLFVLAVGINAYPAKERLRYAVKDARDVIQTLRGQARPLYREVDVKLLTNQEADRQGILNGIAWLQREVTAQDLAVIFYAGHGARHPAVGFFLVPARFKDAQPLQTMVSGAELKRAAGAIRGPVVVLLDCCHAGAILNERLRFPDLRPLEPAGRLTVCGDGNEPSPRLAFLCAARPREESEENRAIEHGTFTKALLRALSGKADFNGDGVVTLAEVERFVMQRVPRATRRHQHALSACSALPRTTPLAATALRGSRVQAP